MKKSLCGLALLALTSATLIATSAMKTAYALNPEPPDIVAVDLSQTVVCPTSITVNGAPMKVTCGKEAFVHFNAQRVYGYTTIFSRWKYTCPNGQVMEITYPPSYSDKLYYDWDSGEWTTLSLNCSGNEAFNNDPKRSQLKMRISRTSWDHNGGKYYKYTVSHYGD